MPRAFQQAFHLMRSGRPGPVLIDLPFDVQMAEIEFDIDTYEPLSVYKPTASRKQIEKAVEMLNASERPLIVAGGFPLFRHLDEELQCGLGIADDAVVGCKHPPDLGRLDVDVDELAALAIDLGRTGVAIGPAVADADRRASCRERV